MVKKKQKIEIPKAVPRKRKPSKPKQTISIAIPKAQTNTINTVAAKKRPQRNNRKVEKPAENFSTGDMTNTSLADAFARAGITLDNFKK